MLAGISVKRKRVANKKVDCKEKREEATQSERPRNGGVTKDETNG